MGPNPEERGFVLKFEDIKISAPGLTELARRCGCAIGEKIGCCSSEDKSFDKSIDMHDMPLDSHKSDERILGRLDNSLAKVDTTLDTHVKTNAETYNRLGQGCGSSDKILDTPDTPDKTHTDNSHTGGTLDASDGMGLDCCVKDVICCCKANKKRDGHIRLIVRYVSVCVYICICGCMRRAAGRGMGT